MSRGTVVAAMSGGVDSAVTAGLLKQEGYDVIGVTLQIWQEHAEQGRYGGCCSLGAVEDARRAAAKLDIPHYVFNFREYFAKTVIDTFVAEYSRGRTPNPCVECNRSVKFDELLRQAEALGADFLATGHYARIRFNEQSGRHELLRARDRAKDQSYALYTLNQRQLSRTLMPLGLMSSKQDTRRLAAEMSLALHDKPDSQEICFVPREGYSAYLRDRDPGSSRPGPVVDRDGRLIGEHQGIAFYTIGQRKRLPPSVDGPLFVLAIDANSNTLVVGSDADLYEREVLVEECSWSAIDPALASAEPLAVMAKIRYNGPAAPALAWIGSPAVTAELRFEQPQRAITPGQSAVLYGGTGDDAAEVVLGGGKIASPLREPLVARNDSSDHGSPGMAHEASEASCL